MPPAARLLVTALAAAALGTGLAACGSDSGDQTSSGASSEHPAATTDGHAGMDHSGMDHGSGAADGTTPAKASTDAKAVDAAFARQMIPHHEMAVAMAKAILEETKRPELRRLATAIVAAQAPEIAALQKVAASEGIATTGAGDAMDADARTLGMSMEGMGMSTDQGEPDANVDRAFLDQMTAHHVGAIAMAKAELSHGQSTELKDLATGIIQAQEREIAQMKRWREAWFGADKVAR